MTTRQRSCIIFSIQHVVKAVLSLNKNPSALFFLGLLLILSVASSSFTANAIRLGAEIPASKENSINLMQSMNSYQNELTLTKKKNKNKILQLEEKFEKTIKDYISSNTCYRYVLADYINLNDINLEEAIKNRDYTASNILIALNLDFENVPDTRIQQLNLNIIDKHGNTLRRKNNLHDKKLHMVVDFPLFNHKNDYKFEYLDICFENLKVDQSWRSTPHQIDLYMMIQFGMSEIIKNYQKHTQGLSHSSLELERIELEIDDINERLEASLEVEKYFRDLNEDTLTKGTIFNFSAICLVFISSLAQVWWLHRYLKTNCLI